MIELFYYVGIFCLALGVKSLLSIKKLKANYKLEKEFLTAGINAGYEASVYNDPSVIRSAWKDSLKKMKFLNVICGLITIFWNVMGLIISEQKAFFIVLAFILWLSTSIIAFITKDEDKRLFCSYVDNIICTLLIGAILYNHFFNSII